MKLEQKPPEDHQKKPKGKRKRSIPSRVDSSQDSSAIPKKYTKRLTAPNRPGPNRHFFRCSLCPKAFFLNWELHEHSMVHAGKERQSCGKCGLEYFPEIFKIETHKCSTESNGKETDSQSSVIPSCQLCHGEFRTEALLKQHQDSTHVLDSVRYSCVICFKNCVRRASLVQHYFLCTSLNRK